MKKLALRENENIYKKLSKPTSNRGLKHKNFKNKCILFNAFLSHPHPKNVQTDSLKSFQKKVAFCVKRLFLVINIDKNRFN